MKKLAINLDNGMTIEVVEVNGGWTTCRDIEDGFEFKLRNSKMNWLFQNALINTPSNQEKASSVLNVDTIGK